jgi:tetratricopeptide (TPR) repeat protein
MDQLSAHLDRGWDLAQKGDAAGATACARRALELDPQSPEVHNLLGFTAALAGETEEALEHYRQAIALDETYLEAMLNAAEVLMHPLGDFDDAIGYCDDAIEYAETPEEIADCILLKVDALLGKGDPAEAKRAMALIPDGPFENSNYTFLVGRAFYEVGDVERARPMIEEAANKEALHPDAHYYLGLVRDEGGDARGAVQAFLRSRTIDLSRPAPAWAPTPEAFATLVQQSVTRLDQVLGAYVRQAEVFIVDVPGAELVVDGVDPRAILILDTPPTTDEKAEAVVRIFVYQRNAERAAGSLEALEPELVAALEREITAVFLERSGEGHPDQGQLN